MKISSLIIDDEALARQRIKKLLAKVHEIEIMGECSSGKEAIKMISEVKPRLIFLDIQMKDMTGFDVLNELKIKNKPLIIFITAFDEFALKGFDYFALDFLLKPFKDDRFYESIKRVKDHIRKGDFNELENKLKGLLNYIDAPDDPSNNVIIQKLTIKIGNKVLFINTGFIKYIVASGYYAEIHTDKKEYLMRESLSNLILRLNPSLFIRIHRSTIINLEFVQELVHSDYNEIDLKMQDGKLFRVSKSYKKSLYKKLGM